MDHYLHVLWESAWVATVIPFTSEPTFFAMLYFGGFNMQLAMALAVLGSAIGMTFNWWLGKLLYKLHKEKKTFHISDYWYERCTVLFNKYGAFLLLLSFTPVIKFVVVMAGFLNTRYRFVMSLVILGHIFSYGFFLLKH